jgi:hypothetical protein
MTGAFLITPVVLKYLHRIIGLQLKTHCFESRLCFLLHDFLFLALQPPQWPRASSFAKFLDHKQRRSTDGRTPLDE